MSRSTRLVIVTLLAVAAMVVTPAVAMACRITNATPWTVPDWDGVRVWVWFDCGHSCGSYYEIDPGKSVAYPKTSGYLQACLPFNQLDSPSDSQNAWPENGRVHVDSGGEGRVKSGQTPSRVGPPDPDVSDIHWDVYKANNTLAKSVDHGSAGTTDRTESKPYCWHGSP
jgi:hypothetical protein